MSKDINDFLAKFGIGVVEQNIRTVFNVSTQWHGLADRNCPKWQKRFFIDRENHRITYPLNILGGPGTHAYGHAPDKWFVPMGSIAEQWLQFGDDEPIKYSDYVRRAGWQEYSSADEMEYAILHERGLI